MTATTKDESLRRSFMGLFMGAALLLLGIQWRAWAVLPELNLLPSTSRSATKTAAANGSTDVRLVVDLSDRKVYVYRKETLLTSYPVAIGQAGWETPTGNFQVWHRRRNPEWMHPITGEVIHSGEHNPLGSRWIGFWSDGHTELGFHGTNQEALIGQAVSHGCIRMRNQDVEALYERVEDGTPVVVRP